MAPVQTTVEELPEDKVRLTVEVTKEQLQHAVEHAASDLSSTAKIPGFRKGKVPMQVLLSRLGKDRVYGEAVESHIGGWFSSAAATSRIRPVAQPEYEYDLPDSSEGTFSFTATVAVQPKVEVVDWTTLEVPALEVEVPEELVDEQLEGLRHAVAELAPVEGRPAHEGNVVVVDLVTPSGEARRDEVVELGGGRMVEEVEQSIVGMNPGETKQVEYELGDDSTASVEVTLKEVKEKVLPPVDDDLARAASEFDTLADLRADIEGRLREQIEEEVETQFRATAADTLVDASRIQPSAPLVESRAHELLRGLLRSLESRGISVDTYLAVTNTTPQELQDRLRAEAARSVARELALEAVADKAGVEVTDDELREFILENARAADEEDPEAVVEHIWQHGRHELLRDDLRLRKALDKVVGEVKRISPDLASARDKLWTPEKEKAPGDSKLWTPASKERA
jgi:trigger factor